MPITINGSGTVTGISAGGLPDNCIVTADIADNNVTTPKVSDGAITQAKRSEQLTRETVKVAGNTSVDFYNIPNWVKRITVMLNKVSTGGLDEVGLRIGASGVIETTGYIYFSSATVVNAGVTAPSVTEYTTYFGTQWGINTTNRYVVWNLHNITGNIWVAEHTLGAKVSASYFGTSSGAGSKELPGTLDRVQLFTSAGAFFDDGTINIMYE
jgi:hypothetical protein